MHVHHSYCCYTHSWHVIYAASLVKRSYHTIEQSTVSYVSTFLQFCQITQLLFTNKIDDAIYSMAVSHLCCTTSSMVSRLSTSRSNICLIKSIEPTMGERWFSIHHFAQANSNMFFPCCVLTIIQSVRYT